MKLFLLLLCGLLTMGCKGQTKQYQWLGTISAPQEFPMEIYNGAIMADDFSYDFDSIWGTQNTGWGVQGGVMSVTTERMSIPHQLKFTWYSLVERKFYSGEWKLDQNKITTLFEEGFIDQDIHKKTTYDTFIVGLAPEGKVILWISGPGNQREVGAFQAKEAHIPKENIYNNAKYMFKPGFADRLLNDPEYKTFKPEVRAKIEREGYPPTKIYEDYRKKYNWKPSVILPKGGRLLDFGFINYNGEQENLFDLSLKNDTYTKRAAPKFVGFYWLDRNQFKHGIWIDTFDEKEILEIFTKFEAEEKIELKIKIHENSKITLSLKSATQEYFIGKANVRAR